MVFIDLPRPRRRRRPMAAGGPAAEPGVEILGIEVTQAIQNMAHGVRLIAGKTTVVRVYLAPRGLAANARVRGEIVVSAAPGAPGDYVESTDAVALKTAAHPNLAAQRRDAALSLNFKLTTPPAGPMTIRLNKLSAASGGGMFEVPAEGSTVQVEFVAGPVLRIRALGIRYTDPAAPPPSQPKDFATHFDHLRSYLRRAYPASSLEWSQAVIDGPVNFAPPFSGPLLPDESDPLWEALLRILHQHVLLIRQGDMNGGWDPRTHYYGLVPDRPGGFFRGAANNVPNAPAPNTIAVGPCGKPRSGNWDDDASYGDWYGAHELAHTFGRRHPGFCQGQGNNDPRFPHAGGKISDGGQDCVGFDVGDADLNLPMRACPHEQWADFMTYCDWQWVSKYTYDGLFERLSAEEAQFAPLVG